MANFEAKSTGAVGCRRQHAVVRRLSQTLPRGNFLAILRQRRRDAIPVGSCASRGPSAVMSTISSRRAQRRSLPEARGNARSLLSTHRDW